MSHPLTTIKRWEREAAKLPEPTMDGEWSIVGSQKFQVIAYRERGVCFLAWSPCGNGAPNGLGFRTKGFVTDAN